MSDLERYSALLREVGVGHASRKGTLEPVLEIADGLERGRALDAPSGAGAVAGALLAMGFDVTAADLDESIFELHGKVAFRALDLEEPLPFEGGSFRRLYNVSLHEIGHLLGLAHSQDQNAIMYAYYGEDRNDLRADDIAGIQYLYGSPSTAPVAVSPGQTVNGHLPQTNSEAHYQVTLQNKLLVRLDGPAGEDFDLYVRYGAAVNIQNGQYDQVSYGLTADELVTVENPQAGTYYILVHSYRGSGAYTLEVEVP